MADQKKWELSREELEARPVLPKSFRFAQSRRSGKPPSDEGGGTAQAVTEGEKQKAKYSLPQSCYSHDSPLVRGGRGCVHNRICGGRAEYARDINSTSL